MSAAQTPRILIDLDGTLAWWEGEFEKRLLQLHPTATLKNPAAYEAMDRWDAPPEIILDVINRALNYITIKPIEGAVRAIAEMQDAGLDVWLCSKNTPEHYFCAGEKIVWVRNRLGAEMARKTILIHDKTLVSGDILIDDRADIAIGAMTPSWTHVVFDADYNREMPRSTPRLKNWADWREVLGEVLEMDFSAPSETAVA